MVRVKLALSPTGDAVGDADGDADGSSRTDGAAAVNAATPLYLVQNRDSWLRDLCKRCAPVCCGKERKARQCATAWNRSAYRFAAWSVAAAAMIADHHRCCEECSVLASMLHAATAASPERTVGNSLAASMLATATAMG